MSYLKQFEELGRDDIEIAGGKAANLGELTRAGFPVPHGFVVSTDGYREFVAARGIAASIMDLAGSAGTEQASVEIQALFAGDLPDDLRSEIADAYAGLGVDVPVAIRSSATAEDLADASFAGQQDTYLNIRGTEAVLAAITRCWGSLWTERAMTYRARQGIPPETVSLAVVVQQMVEADAAGVMFTANPANGRRDELVISAAWGLGEAVVSGQVNTDDLVLDKRRNVINSRQTAEKMIMTSYADLGTTERPVPEDRRRAEVLTDDDAKALAALGIRIEDHYRAPQDIEWARSGAEFFILQSRPITALPDAEAPMPTDWSVPERTDLYVRASIVEQLPDPLTPLFAEMIDGSVTRSLRKLMNELLAGDVIRDGDVGLPTVNGYAYYRYTRAGMARITMRMGPAFRVLSTNGERSGLTRWRDYSHPRYRGVVAEWTARPIDQLDDHELLDGVAALLDAGTEYYTSVQTIIPIAATAEIIFSAFYDRLVRRPGDPAASTFLLGFDSEPIRAEQSLYDLAAWTRNHPELTEDLLNRSGAEVLDPATGGDDADWAEWRRRFHDHLERFGHAVYNLDFANAVPADAPAPLLDALRYYLGGQGADPAERRRRSSERREKTSAAVAARLDPIRRAGFERLLRRAQVVAPAREDALADVGLAWPQLRRMLLELGRRLVARGAIRRPEDVFWLQRAEIADPTPDSPTRSNAARRSGAVSGGPPRRSCCPGAVRGSSRCGGGCRPPPKTRSAT